jgi:hypothetical protein
MIRPTLRIFMPVIAAGVAATLAAACSEESSSTPAGAGGSGGNAGSAGSAGRGGSSGSSGASGTSGASGASGTSGGDGGDLYVCHAARNPNPDPGGTAAAGAACCGTFGTCTARASVPATITASLGKDDCAPSGDLLCAPKDPSTIPGLPNGRIPSCVGTYGSLTLEGRCLPRCFTLGNKAAASLGPGDCSEALAQAIGIPLDEVVCAPCYNPLDGTATGACSQFGDTPAQPAPSPFVRCGAYGDAGSPQLGYCVPQELVSRVTNDTSLIPVDTCGAGLLCAPANKVEDPNMCFEKCAAALGGDGACVPTYIVEAPGSPGAGYSSTLGQVTCQAGETCTPCINPLATDGAITGACNN